MSNLQGQMLHILKGHTEDVVRVVFSPDGQIIASASKDKTVKLWNIEGELLSTLQHTDDVYSVIFSPDSKTIVSVSGDKTIKLWSLDLDNIMVRGCDWARDYLNNNPNVSEEDRKICHGIGNE